MSVLPAEWERHSSPFCFPGLCGRQPDVSLPSFAEKAIFGESKRRQIRHYSATPPPIRPGDRHRQPCPARNAENPPRISTNSCCPRQAHHPDFRESATESATEAVPRDSESRSASRSNSLTYRNPSLTQIPPNDRTFLRHGSGDCTSCKLRSSRERLASLHRAATILLRLWTGQSLD